MRTKEQQIKHKNSCRERVAKARANGLCIVCCKNQKANNKSSCEKCLLRAAQYSKNHRKSFKTKSYKLVAEWRKNNPGKSTEIYKRHQDLIRKIVFDHYGNKCACCGESEIMFLTLDHINNDNERHNGKSFGGFKFYKRLINNNFPAKPALRTLCWNCNCGRARNGGTCPHEEKINARVH